MLETAPLLLSPSGCSARARFTPHPWSTIGAQPPPRDSWSLFSPCLLSSTDPGLRSPVLNPGCAEVAVRFTATQQRQGPSPCEFGRPVLGGAGGSRGPPDARAWLGLSVWQAAPKLRRSCCGEFPIHAREWHRGRSCNTMPLKPSAARESKAYSSSWGH